MMLLTLLLGCERDPSLYGYWDVVSLRVGATEGDADEATLAGFMEFAADDTCHGMFSYVWDGIQLVPDPRPDLELYTAVKTSSIDDAGDLGATWHKKDETYTMTMTVTPLNVVNTFMIEDWAGSTTTLVSETAIPPGLWAEGVESRMYVAIELER